MRSIFSVLSAYAVLCAADQKGGHELWVKHVTAGNSKVSIWTNKAQLEKEAMKPSLPQDQTHPWVVQTRFDFTENVADAPADTQFVMIEIGATPFCGTDSCMEQIVLFGLQTANNNGDVQLHSYKPSTYNLQHAVKALHSDATTKDALIKYGDMQPDAVKILYKFYPSNSSFFGVGGGKTPDGGRIDVQELIADNLVAPLEIFTTASGQKESEYTTPLVYHHSDSAATKEAVVV